MRDRDFLDKIQIISSIIASIAVPLLVAYFGWNIQYEQSKNTSKQEFVKMALNVLSDKSDNVNSELRSWAIKVIDDQSPVPLSNELSSGIKSGKIEIRRYIIPPKELLNQPAEMPVFKGKTNGDLLTYVLELQGAYQLNLIDHKYLLKWLNAENGGMKAEQSPSIPSNNNASRSQ